jgi:hypothetical protein
VRFGKAYGLDQNEVLFYPLPEFKVLRAPNSNALASARRLKSLVGFAET